MTTVATIAFVALTLWLGRWQVDRRHEKEALQSLLEARMHEARSEHEAHDALSRPRAYTIGEPTMKILIIILLIGVVASLFSGLYFVYKDKGQSNRAVISLTIRIALSVLVFAILMVSYYFGLIPGRLQ